MQVFYSGADEFNCLTSRKRSISPSPVQNNFVKVTFADFDAAIYRKAVADFSWFAAGFGIAGTPETLVFPSNLKITKVVHQDSRIIGLSDLDHSLYESVAEFDKFSESLTWTNYSKIGSANAPDIDLMDVAGSEGCGILAVDSDGGIYVVNKVGKIRLELLFKLDNFKIKKISCGFDHHLVLTDTGAIYSWGIGSRGQLGHFDIVLKCESPKRVEFFDDLPCTIIDIACGGWHSLALTSDGDIYSWGWNASGQLGHSVEKVSTVVANPFPVDLGSGDNPIVAISAGSRHSAAVLKTGETFTWGWNKYGQLGLGDTSDRFIPSRVETICNNREKYAVQKISCTRWGTVFYSVRAN